MRPLAYSSQFGELDDVRTASILGRHAPDAARVALFDEGIRTAAGPVHIPARPEIGLRARVCVPLVGGGRRLGYLWLFEEPAVTEAEMGSRAPPPPRPPHSSGQTRTPSCCAAATSSSSSCRC